MKRNNRTLVAAIAAAVFALGSTAAVADSRGERGPRHDDARHGAKHGNRDGGHAHRYDHWHRDAHARHWVDRHGYRHVAPVARHGYGPHWRMGGRGAGPRHDLYVGRPVPVYYRTPHYVVRDWRGHRLGPPPRGHHWVQAGADYLLIAVGTGLIAQVVLGW